MGLQPQSLAFFSQEDHFHLVPLLVHPDIVFFAVNAVHLVSVDSALALAEDLYYIHLNVFERRNLLQILA